MPRAEEMAVLVDLSRDGLHGGHLSNLHQDDRFRATWNERRLRQSVLDRCDALVIQTLGVTGYTAKELSAIRRFVRNGGGLFLATSAGEFEHAADRPIAESAAQQVGDLFRLRFLSPSEARGKTRYDASLRKGYRRDDLAITPTGPFKGFRTDDLVLDRAAPLELPKGARTLLRHRRTKEPVAATLTFGRGRIFAVNAGQFGFPWEAVGRYVVEWLARPASRRTARKPLPDVLKPTWTARRRAKTRIRHRNVMKARLAAIIKLVADLSDWSRKLSNDRDPAPFDVEIVPGVGCSHDWHWQRQRPTIRVGADTCEPALVYGLARAMCNAGVFRHDGYGGLLYRTIDPDTLARHLALRALERFSFQRQACAWRAVLESWPDGRGDPRAIDLGRWRNEAGPSPTMWLWRALEEDFGPRLIDRFLKTQPRQLPWKKFPHWDVFTELDILIYYLSLAAKQDLFKWFAARGMRVHPIPLVPTKDQAFERRCLAAVRRQLRDTTQAISERFDAARVLLRARIHKRVSLTREARALSKGDEVARLVAGMRFARARDPRGRTGLRRLARRSSDVAYAAIATVTLVEMGDAAAADRLAELADGADTRFRLDAQAALAQVGRDGPRSFKVRLRRPDQLMALGEVDGYAVANIFSGWRAERWPQGVVVPRLFINWVHTAVKWRRKGISRALMTATLRDRWNRRAATNALWTGTTNTAHAMYRKAGFIDVKEGKNWTRSPAGPVSAPRVKGVRLRKATPRDVTRMTDLFNTVYREYLNVNRRPATELLPGTVAVVAEKDRAMVGFVSGSVPERGRKGKAGAHLQEVCVKPDKETQAIARALAARFCTEAARRGATSVAAWSLPQDDDVRRGFHAAGFTSRRHGGISMWRLNNLALLLEHIAPLLEHRLKEKKRHDWCGTIAIRGGRHKARLRIDAGNVKVMSTPTGRADITVKADDDTIARIMCGRQTVFQAFLQTDLRLTPKPNRDVTTLLECLFPRMKVY